MQIPKNQNNTPIDPSSPIELIIFIALPILLIVVYFIAKKQRKNKDV